jgi:hypothetical protein
MARRSTGSCRRGCWGSDVMASVAGNGARAFVRCNDSFAIGARLTSGVARVDLAAAHAVGHGHLHLCGEPGPVHASGAIGSYDLEAWSRMTTRARTNACPHSIDRRCGLALPIVHSKRSRSGSACPGRHCALRDTGHGNTSRRRCRQNRSCRCERGILVDRSHTRSLPRRTRVSHRAETDARRDLRRESECRSERRGVGGVSRCSCRRGQARDGEEFRRQHPRTCRSEQRDACAYLDEPHRGAHEPRTQGRWGAGGHRNRCGPTTDRRDQLEVGELSARRVTSRTGTSPRPATPAPDVRRR